MTNINKSLYNLGIFSIAVLIGDTANRKTILQTEI